MARRKLQGDEDSSLELFLSTSCDAFGGIVFIMLLVMLLRAPDQGLQTGPAEADTRTERAALETARTALAHKERIYDVLQQTAGNFGDAVARERLARWAKLNAQEHDLREAVELRRASVNDLEQSYARAQANLKFLQQAREELKQGLLLAENESARDGELRQTRLPRLRKVHKGNYFLAIFQGKVYPVWRPDSYGARVDNREDFVIEEVGEWTKYTVRPDKGMSVKEWLSSRDGVRLLKAVLPSDLVIAHIVLSPESLADFSVVRNAFTGAGFDYNWTPLAKDRSFVLGSVAGPKDAQ